MIPMTNTCSITFNTKDNRETHRYEVWCVTVNLCNISDVENRTLIGWVVDPETNCCLEEVLEIMGGDFLHFVDTEEPIGGEE